MSIRIRAALWFGTFSLIVLVIASYTIYIQYAQNREKDFFRRLKNKAQFALSLKNGTYDEAEPLFSDMSRHYAYVLPDENAFIFDKDRNQVFNLNHESPLVIDSEFLDEVAQKKEAYQVKGEFEIAGVEIKDNDGNIYYGVAGANDLTGKGKLAKLRLYILLTIIGCMVITGFLAYFLTGIILGPVMELSQQIRDISLSNLNNRVKTPARKDEIGRLADNFNEMMARLQSAAYQQKAFIQYASHEMRTPLTVIQAQIDNSLASSHSVEELKETLQSVGEDNKAITELINNLLLLSQVENPENIPLSESIRVDELLDETARELVSINPDWKIELDFETLQESDEWLYVKGNSSLLKSAFRNLLKNGCSYSPDHKTLILLGLCPNKKSMHITFRNKGPIVSGQDREKMFIPFWRGTNGRHRKGYGLGLAITRKIFAMHHSQIQYSTQGLDWNEFRISVPVSGK